MSHFHTRLAELRALDAPAPPAIQVAGPCPSATARCTCGKCRICDEPMHAAIHNRANRGRRGLWVHDFRP